ncbi:hypothetical protein Tco_0517509 [Tanacetum coccineum]
MEILRIPMFSDDVTELALPAFASVLLLDDCLLLHVGVAVVVVAAGAVVKKAVGIVTFPSMLRGVPVKSLQEFYHYCKVLLPSFGSQSEDNTCLSEAFLTQSRAQNTSHGKRP